MGYDLSKRRTTSLTLALANVAGRWARARGIAVFRNHGGHLRLLASDRLTQPSLNYLRHLWLREFEAIAPGCVHAHMADAADTLHVVIPCLSGRSIRGLLYLETTPAALPPLEALHALGTVTAALLGNHRTTRRPAHTVRAGAAGFAEAENLRALLQRHEWNIARVARLLGVTRMTIYNRLRRYEVAREHVRKQPRCERSPSGWPEGAPSPVLGAA